MRVWLTTDELTDQLLEEGERQILTARAAAAGRRTLRAQRPARTPAPAILLNV